MPIDPAMRRAAHAYIQHDEVPDSLQCGISWEVMRLPVHTGDPRHAYEEEHLRTWLEDHGKHPVTQEALRGPVLQRHTELQRRALTFRHALFHAYLDRGQSQDAARVALENAVIRRKAKQPPAPVTTDPFMRNQARALGEMNARVAEARDVARQAHEHVLDGDTTAEWAEGLAEGFTALDFETHLPVSERNGWLQSCRSVWRHALDGTNILFQSASFSAAIIPTLVARGHIGSALSALSHVPPGQYGNYSYRVPDEQGRLFTGPTRAPMGWHRELYEENARYTVTTISDHGVIEHDMRLPGTHERVGYILRHGDDINGVLELESGKYAGELDEHGEPHGLGRLVSQDHETSGLFSDGHLVHGVTTSNSIQLAARWENGRALGILNAPGSTYEGEMAITGMPWGIGQMVRPGSNVHVTEYGVWRAGIHVAGGYQIDGTRYGGEFRQTIDMWGEPTMVFVPHDPTGLHAAMQQ